MSDFFDRRWRVQIDPPGQTGYVYDSLRTTFEVTKNFSGSSNKSKISLYNLSAESRSKFQKGSNIRLDVGYAGLVEVLYNGNIIRATSHRHGPDIVTTFECGEAERQLVNARLDRSYPEGTPVLNVLADLSKALGIGIAVVVGVGDEVFNGGFVASGSVAEILTEILTDLQLEWTIANGSLQITPVKGHDGDDPVLLTPQTGLIDVPSQGEGFITFTSLLNPRLRPGSMVQLVSSTFRGGYKIRTSKFEGDSHGNKWNVTCESTPLPLAQEFKNVTGDISAIIGGTA